MHRLRLAAGSPEGCLFVPDSYDAGRPAPLIVLFHGAGGNATDGLGLLRDLVSPAGTILLAPDARHITWDGIQGAYGPDVNYLNRALEFTFDRYAVDPSQVAVGGFSDGASYALSLGIINGRFFRHILAFAPGFMAPTRQQDLPRIYVAHGKADPILPIAACSRKIVPTLRRAGYDVRYREFDGGHTVPADVRREAIQWFLDQPGPAPNRVAG